MAYKQETAEAGKKENPEGQRQNKVTTSVVAFFIQRILNSIEIFVKI